MQQTVLPLLQQGHRGVKLCRPSFSNSSAGQLNGATRIAWSRLVTDPTKDVALLIADGERWFFRKTKARQASIPSPGNGWLAAAKLGLVGPTGDYLSGMEVLRQGHKILVDKSPREFTVNPRQFCRERGYTSAIALTYSFDPLFLSGWSYPTSGTAVGVISS